MSKSQFFYIYYIHQQIFNPDSDHDVCWIAPKMSWIHYIYMLGVTHFVECHENRPLTVWEMLVNFLNSPTPQWWGKWKSDLKYVSGTGSSLKVNGFFRLIGSIIIPKFQWNRLITFAVILHTDWQANCSVCRTASQEFTFDVCIIYFRFRTGASSRWR